METEVLKEQHYVEELVDIIRTVRIFAPPDRIAKFRQQKEHRPG